MIKDCHVDVSDLKNAHIIFGPDLAGLSGRTVRRKPKQVEIKIVAYPCDFLALHKFIVPTADIMFVNGLRFLLTRLQGIQLITIKYLPRWKAKIIG
jgi:hypothetical protein